jgi:elongation factor Ts
MAQISAALVKELRERTGAGMMECKKALTDSEGDIEAAVAAMRKAGLAKADKKAGRIAADGLIVLRQAEHAAVLVEVNCETDFVAKGDDFHQFAGEVAELVLRAAPADLAALADLPLADGPSVEQVRRELIAKLGENISVRRFSRLTGEQGRLAGYLHGTRIGVVVEVSGGDAELAHNLALHIAASRPLCIQADQVPAEVLAKEREIYLAQAADSGKPADLIEKRVDGKLRKYIAEVTLLGQPFVKDPERTVEQLLKAAQARVIRFERFELGEGIAKKSGDFVAEVMAQVRGDDD